MDRKEVWILESLGCDHAWSAARVCRRCGEFDDWVSRLFPSEEESKEMIRMDATEFIGSGSLLSAKTVRDDGIEGTELAVTEVEGQEFEDKKKLVLTFDKIDHKLALNATNTKIMIEAFGKETREWLGKRVSLILVKTNFQGSPVDSIQVKPAKEKEGGK